MLERLIRYMKNKPGVWFASAVIVGIALILLTGWEVLDPIIAIGVGINILFTGYGLVRRSVVGLLDAALPGQEVEVVRQAMDAAIGDAEVAVTELRTRESGRQRFVQAVVTVPGEWTVQHGHDVADQLEDAVDRALPGTTTVVHVEPAPRRRPG